MIRENFLKWIEDELGDKLNGKISVEEVKISDAHGARKIITSSILPFGKLKSNVIYFLDIPVKSKKIKNILVELPFILGSSRSKDVEFGFTVFRAAAIIDASVSSTIVVKKIFKSFFNEEYAFVPFTKDSAEGNKFYWKSVWKEKKGWNKLLESLNSDKELMKMIESIPKKAEVGSYTTEVGETVCQILPWGKKTSIIIANAPEYECGLIKLKKIFFNMNKNLDILERIAGHIEKNQAKSSGGVIEKNWAIIFYINEYLKRKK